MTLSIFLILLTITAALTSLITEAVKKLLDSLKVEYASNIVVLFIAIIVGALGTVLYYLWNDIAWTTINIICIFLMALANWLGAMVGYDKVKQAISQLMAKKGE